MYQLALREEEQYLGVNISQPCFSCFIILHLTHTHTHTLIFTVERVFATKNFSLFTTKTLQQLQCKRQIISELQ